jgi:hypothetical protein
LRFPHFLDNQLTDGGIDFFQNITTREAGKRNTSVICCNLTAGAMNSAKDVISSGA